MTDFRAAQPAVHSINAIDWMPIQIEFSGTTPVHFLPTTEGVFRCEIFFQRTEIHEKATVAYQVMEKWLKEGTKSKSGKAFSEEVDFLGGSISLSFNKDYFIVTIGGVERSFGKLLRLAAEVLFEPKLDEQDFTRVLQNLRQEYLQSLEKTEVLARIAMSREVFASPHPYHNQSELTHFDTISTSEVTEIYQRILKSSAIIFLVGATDLKSELKPFTQLLSNTHSDEFPYLHTDNTLRHLVEVNKKGAVQNAIRMGKIIIPTTHPDSDALQLGITALGGYFESRLNRNLREDKGYTYGIHTGQQTMLYTSFFGLVTQVGSDVSKLAMKEIERELQIMQQELMGEEELFQVKSYVKGGMLRAADGPFKQIDVYKECILNKLDIARLQTDVERLEEVSASQIQKAMQQHLQWDSIVKIVAGAFDNA